MMKIEMSEEQNAEFLEWCNEYNPCEECIYNEPECCCIFPCNAVIQVWHLLR